MHGSGKRPRTLHEVARRHLAGEDGFDRSLREFLDSFYLMPPPDRPASIAACPEPIGDVHDAYLAAVAEHLARRDGLPIPDWTEAPDRFLHRPFFAGGLDSLRAILLVESPTAFRRRMLFVSADALSRPREHATPE
jgi:hypothetical protein